MKPGADPGSDSCGLFASAGSGPLWPGWTGAEVYRTPGHCSYHKPDWTLPLHRGWEEVWSPLGHRLPVSTQPPLSSPI